MQRLRHLFVKRKASDCSTPVENGGLTEHSTHKEKIRVRIIAPSARIFIYRTDVDKRLSDLKNEIMLELSDDQASITLFAADVRNLSPRFRLVRAGYDGIELAESLTLAQLGIKDNDELALLTRRNHLQQISLKARDTRAPRDIDVREATRNINGSLCRLPLIDVNEIFHPTNLQFDVRKVLISLAEEAAHVIGAGPYASRLIAMLKQKLINKETFQDDVIKSLMDMGFSQKRAEHALKLHNGNYSVALEYLIAHQNEEIDESVLLLQASSTNISPSGILESNDVVANTRALLDIVRIYSHREIPASPDSIESLVDMGFEERDVVVALRKTCNNKAAACDWLCGNRTASLVELREGLSEDSTVLKSILQLPQVQMSLGNPKMFIAFLSILENEQTLRVWGNDNDTTTVITRILQKYHEEKHVIGMNQFYDLRT